VPKLTIEVPEENKERLQTLLVRSQAGELTPSEQQELNQYLAIEDIEETRTVTPSQSFDSEYHDDSSPNLFTQSSSLTQSVSEEGMMGQSLAKGNQSPDTQANYISLILEPQHKKTLEKAAAKRCLTLSEYLLELVLNAATQELATPEPIVLDEQDWDIFASALKNPPEPNRVLKEAFKRHQN
jgi:uncharacterized protein (DUF1778 family)